MVHTPRICIDGRAATDLHADGLLAAELVDQMVASHGVPGASSVWIERRRLVTLAHPLTLYAGQIKRYETKVHAHSLFSRFFWEKRFLKHAPVSAFLRFRRAGLISFPKDFPTVTFLLPGKKVRGMGGVSENRRVVVPSRQDAQQVEKGMASKNIRVMQTSVRRYVEFVDRVIPTAQGKIVIAVDKHFRNWKSHLEWIQRNYPNHPHTLLFLDRAIEGKEWRRLLEGTAFCIYLRDAAFDWPFLALESIYWTVPTIFADRNASLRELLPKSALQLSAFMAERPDWKKLHALTREAHTQLKLQGVFEPFGLARQCFSLLDQLPLGHGQFVEEEELSCDTPPPVIA